MSINEIESQLKKDSKGESLHLEGWKSSGRLFGGDEEWGEDLSLRSFRTVAEIRAIHCALERTGWNRKRAAALLSISYRCLLYKIRQHNITHASHHN